MQIIRSLIFVFMTFLSFAAQASDASAREVPPEWGGYQGLEASAPRLTLLVYSFLFESYLQDLETRPAFYKHLLESTSISVSDRRLATSEFFENWALKIAQSEVATDEARLAPLSSKAILASFTAAERLAALEGLPLGKRAKFTAMMLRSGFGDATRPALELVHRLEGERDLGVRLRTLVIAANAMARDESGLVAAASIANLISQISSDPSVSERRRLELGPHAIKLAIQIREAAADLSKIDLLSPEKLMGGGIVFRLAVPIVARSAGWRLLQNLWTTTSIGKKATVVSVAGHALVLGALSQRAQMPQANQLVEASERSVERQGIAATARAAVTHAPPRSRDLSVDAAHHLAEQILYSKSTVSSAEKYAELIAVAERLLPRADLRKAYSEDLRASDYIANRDDIGRRFDRYMATRGITIADSEAIAVLRGYVDFFVGPHQENQAIAALAALRPGDGGNCVARALNFTAFFYPAYKKYENPQFRFGIMNWTNHVEAVLYHAESESAVALYSMSILDRANDPQGSPAVVDPREFAAAFLYREKSPRIWQGMTRHLSERPLYSRSHLELSSVRGAFGERFKDSLGGVLGRNDLTTSSEDRDKNPSPFISSAYADPFTIPDARITEMNGSWSRRRVSRLAVRNALSAVLRKDIRAGQLALRLPVVGASGESLSNTPGFEDPGVTRLSARETGFITSTRKVSLFPVSFDRGRIRIHVIHKNFPGSRKTPFRTAAEFEDEIVARARAFQLHPKWKQLTNGELATFESLGQDVDFASGLVDFAMFQRFVFSSREAGAGEAPPFRADLADRLEALGLRDEFEAAGRAIDRITESYVSDASGKRLRIYFESSNGAKIGDRIRRFHILPVLAWAGYDSKVYDRYQKIVLKLGIRVVEPNLDAATEVPVKPTDSSKMTITILPPRGEMKVAAPQELRLDPVSALLYLHYEGTNLSPFAVNDAMKILADPKHASKMIAIAEKFFQWMPMIDQVSTWQNLLSNRWIDDGEKYCGRIQANREGPDVTRPSLADANSCRLSSAFSSLLRFDEAYLNFVPPSLD